MERNLLTEEKIKCSARGVFYRKGYTATRISDIAINAGVNRSLVNYYFRSKQALFEIIMKESIATLSEMIQAVINDEQTNIGNKIDLIVTNYSTFLENNKELPSFILREIQTNPDKTLGYYFDSLKGGFSGSTFYRQLEEHIEKQSLRNSISAEHVIINIISICIYPFLDDKLMMKLINRDDTLLFDSLIEERKYLNAFWIKKTLNLS
ncbi:MAG: TetR family transcriptional regulator [Bacteroides graminisolvens]|nr:TetR family transcriptional regulator [Bacteroides graminisolvens]